MPNDLVKNQIISMAIDPPIAALLHKCVAASIYTARLTQAEFDRAQRGIIILENLLRSTGYLSDAELRAQRESAGTMIVRPL